MKQQEKPASGKQLKKSASSAPAAPVAPVHVPPLFRKLDWFTFAITTLLVMIGYWLTISPDVTLEDSGELAVASHWAGVPHPPGYPVWTLYTWLFTKLVPFSNVAWRVALSSAVASALSCGLIALLVSRGSSMMMESIAALKEMDRKKESVICVVTGLVAGLLMGFNGYMWSQAVIVEVYTLSVLSLMLTLACLLRWIYAPHQLRYLYYAMFFFGICLTNHMSLLVAAVGILVLVGAANKDAGRELFIGSAVAYMGALIMAATGNISVFKDNVPLFLVFNAIGLMTVVGSVYFTVVTQGFLKAFMALVVLVLLAFTLVGLMKAFILGLGVLAVGIFVCVKSWPLVRGFIRVALVSLVFWGVGAVGYFYMPVASMTNPPLNWGYPRTPDGFLHAVKRGQYESVKPVNPLGEPMKFAGQIGLYLDGAREEFTMLLLVIALTPFLFFRMMANRERAWIIGLGAVYLCLSMLLLILLNPGLDRQNRELHKVFFTASHVFIAMGVGYGLALMTAFLVTKYEEIRQWAVIGSGVALLLGFLSLAGTLHEEFKTVDGLSGLSIFTQGLILTLRDGWNFHSVVAALVLFALMIGLAALIFLGKKRVQFPLFIGLVGLIPFWSIMAHWYDNEQKDHWFGYWFGHDMFHPEVDTKMAPAPKGVDGKPLYPPMTKDAVLFGGTDPGRFNPTYMIFSASFLEEKDRANPAFDRRDVYIITQNALADGTYLSYIRAHYNRSAQKDPPFFQEFEYTKLLDRILPFRVTPWLDRTFLKIGDDIEKERRVGSSFFKPDHFKDTAAFAAKLIGKGGPEPLSTFLREKVTPETRNLLGGAADARLSAALAKDLNAIIDGDSIWQSNRFAGVTITPYLAKFISENPLGHTRVRLNRLLLEAAYPEIVPSIGGLYPDREILTPSPDDSAKAFNDYLTDAQLRHSRGQLKPGEDFRIDPAGRVQVSGQVAVMAINGLLTKVIFDKNPQNEFFVEESFPLDWMFPYLTPFGVIMKINREPLPEITQEIVDRDHRYWSEYMERTIGKWLTYETSLTNICQWAERVYLHGDYKNFTGDRKFVRDDNAQKAFSKLRSSIGGIYAWRVGMMGGVPTQPQFLAKTQAERERMIKEAEFAFKQALALCPYSPEAVYRLINLLAPQNRYDEALLVAKTCLKFDPENGAIVNLVSDLERLKKGGNADVMQEGWKVFNQALAAKATNEAAAVLDQIVQSPTADPGSILNAVRYYSQWGMLPRVEVAMRKFVQIQPENPEGHYDLAAIEAMSGKTEQALDSLAAAIRLSNQRRAANPTAADLKSVAAGDQRFQAVRGLPGYAKAIEGK